MARLLLLIPLALIPLSVSAQPKSKAPAAESTDPTEVVRSHPPQVTPNTVQGIERGIGWLARRQSRDGAFRVGRGMGKDFTVAMTALAGMAFLCHGDTPTRGRYAATVRRTVQFLIHPRQVLKNGLITEGTAHYAMYGHGFAMMFLACALGETGDPVLEARIKRVLRNAIKLTIRSQTKDGGWYYTPNAQTDEGSVTVTQVQALRACQNAGVTVPFQVIRNAIGYIENSQNADGGIAYTVKQKGRGSNIALSASACTVLYNAGKFQSKPARACLSYCRKMVKITTRGAFGHWYYTHYYMSQAWWQSGGKDWSTYYPQLRDRLLQSQKADGSWMGDGVGHVYGTALAVTMLSLPYERVPLYMR